MKSIDHEFSFETNLLEAGAYFRLPATNPEALPIHLTTAHNVEDLDDLQKRYDEKGFCYNRNRNPNRTALIELMNYVEGGEDSVACSSGMAAIASAIIVGEDPIWGNHRNIHRYPGKIPCRNYLC